MCGQHHAPAALSSRGNKHQYPSIVWAPGLARTFWRRQNLLFLPEFEPRNVQPVVWSLYRLSYLHTLNTSSLLTYLLTPWIRVLLEKLTGFQLVKKFLSFFETRRFITSFTSARHLFLFWASLIQPITYIPLPEDPFKYYPPIYAWVSQVVYFPQVSAPKSCIHISSPPYTLHAPPISSFSILSPEQ